MAAKKAPSKSEAKRVAIQLESQAPVKIPEVCMACNGSGQVKWHSYLAKCWNCNGTGRTDVKSSPRQLDSGWR